MSTPISKPEIAPDAADRYAALLKEAEAIHGISLGRDAWRRLKRNRTAMIALYFLATVALLSFFTPLLPLAPPRKIDLTRKYQPPQAWPIFVPTWDYEPTADEKDPISAGFGDLTPPFNWMVTLRVKIFGKWTLNSLCGTDNLGRDLLARLFWGSRVSLVVGLVATLVSLIIGVSYGAVSGYVGGWLDNILMRGVDVLYSIPFIFVVIYLITVLSEPAIKETLESWHVNRITVFFAVVGAIYWLTMARVVRGQVMSLKHEQFVEAARTIGGGQWRIIFRHLVPNLWSVIIVYLTLTIPDVMLFEAFLSFLGLGVEPPDVSWGLLANDGVAVITPVKTFWWLVAFPGLALGLTLLSLNFLGDGLRDALDPRMKNKQ